MPCYRLRLAYDGTDFEGWQVQSTGSRAEPPRTVQGELESALGRLAGGALVRVAGAGRTDSGVHTEDQVVTFELPKAVAPSALARALNGLLAHDVRVLEAAEVSPSFHPRRDAVSKRYRYVLDTGPVQLPLRRRFAAHLAADLEPEVVREVAALYLGRHDFASLASSGGSVKTTVRTVSRSEVRFEAESRVPGGATMIYEVSADGFLRKMVRSLVGGLIAAGTGGVTPRQLAEALEARDRRRWPAPAPARGLTLVRVDYDTRLE